MSANHADGCPAIADPRDGCSCLLRGVAAQEDHEPECPGYPYTDDPSECICAALRACEARAYVAGVERENRSYGFAFQQGLDAARDAVAALDRFHFSAARSRGYPALTVTPVAADYPDSYLFPPAALAAIDALR